MVPGILPIAARMGAPIIKYLVIIGIVLALIGGYTYMVYNNGRKVERSVWLEWQQNFLADAEKIKAKRQIENDKERERHNLLLARVINEKEKLQSELNKRMHDITAGGLWINAKACSGRNGLPTKAKSTEKPDSGADRIRLPDEDAENIQRDYADAQRVVNQYVALREICLPLVDVVE